MRLANDGSLQLYYSALNSDTDQDSLLIRSTDGGATWDSPQTISGTDVEARDGMLGVTKVPGTDAGLIAVFESLPVGGVFSIHSVNSSDDGATWGNRETVYTASDDHNAGAPQIVTVGTTLAVSFMTDEDSSSTGTYPDDCQIKLVTSSNEGASWGSSVLVGDAVSHWAGELDLDDSSWLVLYANEPSVYSQKMTL